jgi:hypothetical protein
MQVGSIKKGYRPAYLRVVEVQIVLVDTGWA